MHFKIVKLDSVDSTNEFLKREKLLPTTVVIADHQTSGKGRRGKQWISPKGKGLYISFLFEKIDIKNSLLMSLATGVAVAKVLNRYKKEFKIKWPNDILINNKKICGILPEMTKKGIIVGIGLNLYHDEKELQGTDYPATSLSIEQISFNKETLTNEIIENVIKTFNELKSGKFSISDFEEYSLFKAGDKLKLIENEKTLEATCIGIDKEGFLIVSIDNHIKRIFSTDISIRF